MNKRIFMQYKYFLPDTKGATLEKETDCNSIIIIGANGSGKTHLGVWIEKSDYSKTFRISAQRSLKFGKYINQKSYEESTNRLLYGDYDENNNHDLKYEWDGNKHNYFISMQNDYETVLSAVCALQNEQQSEYVKDCKAKESNGLSHNNVPQMVFDRLYNIWHSIFPHRDICISDGKVICKMKKDSETVDYSGREMSDGERVALYLICQALCVPGNKIIIIDEPEIHLHPSITNKLWKALENERTDCLFVYITHDTQFASNHTNSTKIWVKSFDGNVWDYEFVENSELPEQLLLTIMGNRKPVLFVEGTNNSYDVHLYQYLYPDYYVVPCGSCSTVISNTKSMNSNPQLHNLKCYGLIDRDYRSEFEIEKYKEQNIFTINVAEVENLFLVQEIVEIVAQHMGRDSSDVFLQVKKYIIQDRFKKQINQQVCKSIVAEIKYRLSTADLNQKTDEGIINELNQLFSSINFDEIKEEKKEIFQKALDDEDYLSVLRLFNEKNISNSVGRFFGIENSEYCKLVISLLSGEKADDIKKSLLKYMPVLKDN